MSANDPNRPFAAFRFQVEIGGVEQGAFCEVSGLKLETAVIEYRNGNDVESTPRKIPGLTKYANVTLKRGYFRNEDLWVWVKEVRDGQPAGRKVTITLLDEQRNPAVRWELLNAWPAKWKGATLKATGNEVAIEALELANEGIRQSIL